jgi:predicted nucleotidyltransferase
VTGLKQKGESMSLHIDVSKGKIAEFCRRNHVCSLAFFGSVLRSDFGPDSDVDVLVEFEQGQEPGLMAMAAIESELSEILHHKADLVERQSVERSENYIRRRHILQSMESVYVA